jgi:GNAT superfamily N-acetyltransferase
MQSCNLTTGTDGEPRSEDPRAETHPAGFVIRTALPGEFCHLGELMVAVYSSLEGFPKRADQPQYYEMLAGIGQLAENPDTKLLVAVSGAELLGGVVHFSDMARYGSGGIATQERNASGFRLLAVAPQARGRGVGAALMERCIELARGENHGQVILHTTAAMQVAWRMYERRGFERSADLDFLQGALQVYGFRLRL